MDKTVKGLEYKLIDKINKYIYCTRAKTKKLNISKKIQEKIETIESKIEIDVTETGKIISMERNKYIHFKIDYYSNKVFVSFLKRKSAVLKNRMDFLNKLNKEKKELPKYIRLDRNTKNKKFRESMKKFIQSLSLNSQQQTHHSKMVKWKK